MTSTTLSSSSSSSSSLPFSRSPSRSKINIFRHGFCWLFMVALLIRKATATASRSDFKNHLVDRVKTKGCIRNRFFALRHGQSEANVARVIASNPKQAKYEYGLSSIGRKQAELAGKQLVAEFLKARKEQRRPSKGWNKLFQRNRNSRFSPPKGVVIVCSDLKRAYETASYVFNAVLEHNDALTEDRQNEVIPLYAPVDGGKLEMTMSEKSGIVRFSELRERWFGEWDGKSDVHYQDVWNDDLVDPYHTTKGVESVWSVLNRATKLVCALEDMAVEECAMNKDEEIDECLWIICVAHGDVLQILQTAFCNNLDPSNHRSLEHLETATLRPFE